MDIPLPRITATDEKGQLGEIRRYLYRLAETLRAGGEASAAPTVQVIKRTGGKADPEETRVTFNALKSLIITSADIVNAYQDKIERALSGKYVASSEYGTFREETRQRISESSTETARLFTNLQQIVTDIKGLESALIEVSARIRTGLLDYDDTGAPVYGVEVGQRNVVDGEETFRKYARFTADRLSFYDRNGTEVAFVGDYKLYITEAEIAHDLKVGGFRLASENGLAFLWEDTL